MNFTDYGFNDLTPETLINTFEEWVLSDNMNRTLRYLSGKTGFDPEDEEMYQKGLDLAASWSWIDPEATTANRFYCQAMKGKTMSSISNCIEQAVHVQIYTEDSVPFLFG